MNIPGAPDNVVNVARYILAELEDLQCGHDRGHRVKQLEELPPYVRARFERLSGGAGEKYQIGLIIHMLEIISSYDGSMGAAYCAAIRRYCYEQLNFDPATGQAITRGYHR
jgi:hypothetical protein